MGARVKLPKELSQLLRSQLEKSIYESALSKEDTLIANRYIIEKVPQIDIACELGWERSTVSRHLPYILSVVSSTASKLFT